MQSPPRFPRKQVILLSIAFFICFLSVLFYSCKKNDLNQTSTITAQQVSDFYKLPADAPPETKIVVAEMQKQLSSQNVHDFLNWHGQPIWNKVFKLTNQENNTVTYLISTNKEGNNTAFIAATIYSTGEVRLELHRKNSLVSKAKEFSYAGIDLQKSTLFLNRFDEKSLETPNTNNNAGLMPADTYCWSEYVMVPCTQTLSKNDTEQNAVAVCYAWLEHCTILIDGGGGGTGGGSGGGTGGGGGGSTPDQCPLWYSLVPVPDCEPNPTDTISISTRLRLYSEAMNKIADSIFQLSMANQWEWGFILVKKNGAIYPKYIRTDSLEDEVQQIWYVQNGEVLLAQLHTHQARTTNVKDRPCFSDDDIIDIKFSHGHHTVKNYISFIECGDVRYALVIEDPAKAIAFYNNNPPDKIRALYRDRLKNNVNYSSNYQLAGEQSVSETIGFAMTSGIALYKSSNSTKTDYVKLN